MADNFFLKALFAFVITCFPVSVFAGAVIDSPGCDPDFYDVIEARSWLEGQREVETAERLILKPDSVLEYSCFDDYVTMLGNAANLMFSDRVAVSAPLFPAHPPAVIRPPIGGTIPQPPLNLGLSGPNPPGAPPFLLSSDLDNALNNVVRTPSFTFLGTNFGHTYAGGTYAGVPPGAASCNAMNAVWMFLKCQDFDINTFRTFLELSLFDPRTVPTPCNDPGRGTRWANALAAAFPVPSFPTLPGGIDIVNPADRVYNTRMLHRTAGCSAAVPIPTGVQIIGTAGPVADAVCSVPGCSYNGSGACN